MTANFGACPKKGFGIVPRWVMQLADLKPGPKALYASFCTNADVHGRLWRSQNRLAAEFNVTRRQIQRWINDLEAAGLLVRFTAPRSSFLLIRNSEGRDWARKTNLVVVSQRRLVFVDSGRAGALKRWHKTTTVSCADDISVQAGATSMSPKHNLSKNINLRKETARQEGVRGEGSTHNERLYGLKRMNPNAHGPAVQSALNCLADQIGWISLGNLEPRQIAARLAAENDGAFTEADALSVLSPPLS
jgi:hypothetical protein